MPPNRLVRKFLTDDPNADAPSFTLRPALLAPGSAARPASSNFRPVYLAPSTTVLPMPLAVSSTP